MSALSDDIVKYFQDSGLIDGFSIQFGSFVEGDENCYFVILPDSGSTARPWMRSPRYRVMIFGKKGMSNFSGNKSVGEIADNLVNYIRLNSSSELHQLIDCTEPLNLRATDSNRAVMQIALTTKS